MGELLCFSLAYMNVGLAQDASIEYTVQKFNQEKAFQGSVLVSKQSKIIYRGAVGHADIEKQLDNKSNSKYLIGPLTKSFTAVMTLQGIEYGELTVLESIDSQFPELKLNNLSAVTLHHLLSNTSGIRDFVPKQKKNQTATDALLAGIRKAKFDSLPGARERNCNACYMLLAHLLEHKTQTPFNELLKTLILTPLNMKNTYSYTDPDKKTGRSLSYQNKLFGGLIPKEEPNLHLATGALDLISTVDDLYLFASGLINEQLLSNTMQTSMWNVMTGSGEFGLAYGVRLVEMPDGSKAQVFGGEMTGASAVILRSDIHQIVIVILSNVGDPVMDLAMELFTLTQTR